MNLEKLKPLELTFWNGYLTTHPNHKQFDNILIESGYAGTRETTNELIGLYLLGKKRAGSSLKADFIFENAPLPEVGNHWIILNSKDEPKCILKTVKVIESKFKNITEDIAIAEGEGDLSLKYWKETHKSFYSLYLEKWRIDNIDEAIVITEYFDFVFYSIKSR